MSAPIPPMLPMTPWFPNEAVNLDGAAQELWRAVSAVDEALALANSEVQGIDWRGPDADSFRHQWVADRHRLEELRRRLVESARALSTAATGESVRFRQQTGR